MATTKKRICTNCGAVTSSKSGRCPDCERHLPSHAPRIAGSIEDVYAQELEDEVSDADRQYEGR